MQVSSANDVKVYNLSAGKSIPEWISDRKKRQLLKGDVDLRRRIELIQDFSMPTASTSIKVSPDGEYLLSTGVYKPRLKCFDMNQLSLKFDRCFNSECIQFEILSQDFSKLILLQADRYVEFHAQYGCYYRTRIPRFGRDMAYHKPSCDLYVVGDGADVFRLNLERGHFMKPYTTDATSINVCQTNEHHQMLAVGTNEGKVECFDPRSHSKVGVLDLALSNVDTFVNNEIAAVTAITFKNELEMAVGTSSGHVLIYDIRSNKPKTTKNHKYELPIKSIIFHKPTKNVVSADSKIIKIWNEDTADNFTSIEPGFPINDVCVYKDSGLIFLANENPKNSVYFVPELGEAPKWCSFLDNITEELEESDNVVVYDDYKFVTGQQLEELGLVHLRGTNYLKAYMHGFFLDVRLYHKAKSIVEPFAYQDYRKNKIREKLEEERASRVKLNKMPKVNKLLAAKLIDEKSRKNDKLTDGEITNPLADDRFSAMFSNRDFQVDMESEEYKLLNPVVSKREKERRQRDDDGDDDVISYPPAKDGVLDDDLEQWKEEVVEKNKQKEEKKAKKAMKEVESGSGVKMYSLKGEDFKRGQTNKKRKIEALGDMLQNEQAQDRIVEQKGTALGSRELTFTLGKKKRDVQRDEANKEHKKERKKSARPVGQLLAVERKKAVFWRGKRVK